MTWTPKNCLRSQQSVLFCFVFKLKNRNTASLHQRSRAGQNEWRLLDSGNLLVWNEPKEPNSCKRVLPFKKREKWTQRQIRVQWAYHCCHGHGWRNQPVTSPPGARSPAPWARGHNLDLKRIILQASKLVKFSLLGLRLAWDLWPLFSWCLPFTKRMSILCLCPWSYLQADNLSGFTAVEGLYLRINQTHPYLIQMVFTWYISQGSPEKQNQ